MNYKQINKKLSEYVSLLDYNNTYFKKDFEGNYKFVISAVKRMIKHNINESEIIQFIETTIKIHKEIYI